MSLLRLLVFGLLLLVHASADADIAGATPPAPSERAELRTDPNEAPFGKFDGHGKLFHQELYQDYMPADWYSTFTYYPRGSRRAYKLQRNVRAINVFLAAEIRRPRTVRTFLKEHLGYFLLNNFVGDGTHLSAAPSIITPAGVAEDVGSDPGFVPSRLTAAQSARLKARIARYAGSDKPVVTGNHWMLDVNVLTDDGAVEHWVAKGRVTPLQIDSFLCEPKEPAGTFCPIHAAGRRATAAARKPPPSDARPEARSEGCDKGSEQAARRPVVPRWGWLSEPAEAAGPSMGAKHSRRVRSREVTAGSESQSHL